MIISVFVLQCSSVSYDQSLGGEMSLAQRVLLTWVFTLVFLIILVLKLDGKVEESYFNSYSVLAYFVVKIDILLSITNARTCSSSPVYERS